MRFNHRSVLFYCLTAFASSLIAHPAWSQSPIPVESSETSPQNESINFQKILKKRQKSFAEKQYESTEGEITYRDKYAISCLIYVYAKNLATLSIDITILSTYKINRCDPSSFIRTTAASVKAQLLSKLDVDFVILSGPHIQMMDFNNTPVENRYMPIGHINYTPIARAHLGISDAITHFGEWSKWLQSIQYYNPIRTNQDIDYTWFPGTTIYEIIASNNDRYIMSHLVAEDLIRHTDDIEKIAKNLGNYLNLPKGWRYEYTTLNKVMQIRQRQYDRVQSYHIQDEFGNIYMQYVSDN